MIYEFNRITKSICESFNEHQVKYCITGGIAVSLMTEIRKEKWGQSKTFHPKILPTFGQKIQKVVEESVIWCYIIEMMTYLYGCGVKHGKPDRRRW
jgi:hypothetical protein